MATGLGKTIVLGHVARDWPGDGRILVLVHREELAFQASDKIGAIVGEPCDIEMGEIAADEERSFASRARVVIASVQTLNSKRRGKYRMEKFNPYDFAVVMTDEGHHAVAPTYRRVYAYFNQNPNVRHLLVTATPDRADEQALGQVVDTVAYEYDIRQAVDDAWLVPIEQQFVHVNGLDLSQCKTNKTDLQDADVAAIMEKEEVLHHVAIPTIQIAGDRQALVFSSSVAHAERQTEIINRYKPASAVCITGATPTDERRYQLQRFARCEFQYLCNCGVFLEGFDEPRISVVAVARPTKSRALYTQIVGRGTRPLPDLVDGLPTAAERSAAIQNSDKPSVLVLDFVGNSGRHKLVSTADILGGTEQDEVIEAATASAKRKGAQGEKVDMRKEIEAARKRLEDQARARRRSLVARASYVTKVVNPFDVFDILPMREPGWHKGRQPTEAMKAMLLRAKMDPATVERMSYSEVRQLIDEIIKRRDKGLCTYAQAKTLSKYGEDPNLSFDEAKLRLDAIARNGWKPLTSPNDNR